MDVRTTVSPRARVSAGEGSEATMSVSSSNKSPPLVVTAASTPMYPWECVIAGSIAGCAGVIVCHPLDVVRTHIQTSSYIQGRHRVSSTNSMPAMNAAQGVGVIGTFRSIWQTQGFTGFYRGITGPLIAQAVYKSLIFTTNSIVHSELARRRYSYYTSPTSSTNNRGNATSSINWNVFLSGMVAGTVNAFVVAPVEMIRTHQILSGTSFLASFQSFRGDSAHPYSTNNVSFGSSTNSSSSSPLRWVLLWRGILPTILRDGPGIGLYFLTFESSKVLVYKYYLNTRRLEEPQPQQRPQPIWCTLLAGSLAGIAFWIWALPIDTIKSNIEASFSSAPSKTTTTTTGDTNAKYSSSEWQWIRSLRGKGFIHLLRAWPVALGRGIPSAAVTLTTYDIITQYLIQYRSFYS